MNNMFKMKQVKIFAVLLLVLGGAFVITSLMRDSYALSSKVYTREEMQDMVVSTALNYFYNTSYSDYGQTSMDLLSDSTNYYYYGTVYWRDLNMTPDMVNRGNYYRTDCSAFAFLAYMNTFGYDASEFSGINRYMLFYGQNEYKMQRVNSFEDHLYYYRDAYEKFGQGWNNSHLTRMINKISDTCYNSACNYPNKYGVVYDNLDNSENNELAYYYYADTYQTPEKLKEEWAKVKNQLLPGDILIINRSTTNVANRGTPNGHVMLYVGEDDKLAYERNLLHSTGYDISYEEDSLYNKLFKSSSIVNSDADTYMERLIDNANGVDAEGNGTKYMRLFAIIRPINTMCTDDNNCKFSNNSYNVELSDEALANNEARVELANYRFEQFMTSHDDNGNQVNIVSDTNSVNVGNKLRYNLQITNKSDTVHPVFSISNKIPDNTEFSYCTYDCVYDEESRTVTWKNQYISPGGYATYRYVVIPNKDGVISSDGMTVTTSSNTLTLSPMKVYAKATFNQSNSDLLESYINKFKSAVDAGKFTFNSTVGDYQFDLDNIPDGVSVSQGSLFKSVYYNAYGIDLGYINSTAIRDAIFNKLDYPSVDNNKTMVDGAYPAYTGDTSTNVFSKKTEEEIESLDNETYENINKMLVPGMYGGVKLKGNENNDRTKFLRSFNNYSLGISSDLQIGDVIVSYYNNSTYVSTYFVTGFDDKGVVLSAVKTGPRFVSNNDQYLSGDNAYYKNVGTYTEDMKPSSQILNELFASDLFVVLRPSRVYSTTVVYDYNYEGKEDETYIAYGTYKELNNPERSGGYKVEYVCGEGIDCPEEEESKFIFEGWYADSSYNEKIEEEDTLKSSEAHKIYAKWGNEKITLPIVEKEGYRFLGWYRDSEYSYKEGAGGEEYEVSGNKVLYARLEKEEVEITSDELEIENGNIYLEERESEIERYKSLIEIEGESNYRIEVYSPEEERIERGRIYTGSITRIYRGEEKVGEYRNIVKGDVNRTGTVSMADVMKIASYLTEEGVMEEEYNKMAADINRDKNIGMNDVMRIVNYLIEGGNL